MKRCYVCDTPIPDDQEDDVCEECSLEIEE